MTTNPPEPQTAAVLVGFSELIDKLREELPAQAHFTFAMSDGMPTVAFTMQDCEGAEFMVKVRALGDLSMLLTELAFKNRNFDCEEDDKHSRWDKSYA